MKSRSVLLFCIFLGQWAWAQPYQPGYFTTLEGKRVDALIKFKSIQCGYLTVDGSVPGKIKIKTDNDSKVYELTAEEVRGFVMGLDSFVVMKNIPVSERDRIKRDFVKVETTGKLTLFVHCSKVPNGRYGSKMKKVYILLPRGTTKLTALHNRYQKDLFLQMISDDLDLSKQVEDDWQWMNHLPQIIRRYNSHFQEVNARKDSLRHSLPTK